MTVQSQTIQKAFMLIHTDSLLPLSFATLSIWIVNVLIFVWNLIRLSSDWHFIQPSHFKFSEIKTKYFRWKIFENQNKKENHDYFYEKKITLYITNFWGDLLKIFMKWYTSSSTWFSPNSKKQSFKSLLIKSKYV